MIGTSFHFSTERFAQNLGKTDYGLNDAVVRPFVVVRCKRHILVFGDRLNVLQLLFWLPRNPFQRNDSSNKFKLKILGLQFTNNYFLML